MTISHSAMLLDRREACAYYHLSEGLTYAEIAQRLGSSRFKVSTDLQRWQRENGCVLDVSRAAADRVGLLRPATAAALRSLLTLTSA